MPAGHHTDLLNKVDPPLESSAPLKHNAKKIRLNHALFLELWLTLKSDSLGSPKHHSVKMQAEQNDKAVASQTWCMDAGCQNDATDMCSCFADSS